MKKIFTDNLYKTWKGVDWEKSIKDKLKIKFTYEDIKGEFVLLDYNTPKRGYIKILYCDMEYFIHSSNLTKCKIGDIVGKINRTMKYRINQNIKDKNRDLTIIDTRHDNGKKMYKYRCNLCGFDCGKHWNIKDKEYKNELWISEYDLNKGVKCSCCCQSPKIVVEDINSIYKTNPWMIPYIGEECAKTHTHGSTDRVKVICPDCGRTKIKSIMTIDLLKSIACSCSDGNSYISKYIFNILNQLQENRQLEEINTEIKYNWCKFYNPFKQKDTYGIYDFVIECKKIIIEADGEFHRKDNKMNGQSKEESEWLDNIKDNLANKHGYKIIRISDEGNIKENILESDLNKLFDLSKIDWLKCNLFATSNLVKVACEYKKNNPSMTTIEIANIMGYCQCSVINWLKKGCKFNWCYYNAKEEQQKSKIGKKIKCIEDGMFFNSITEASIYYSIEDSSISAVCNGKRKTAGKRKFEFTA